MKKIIDDVELQLMCWASVFLLIAALGALVMAANYPGLSPSAGGTDNLRLPFEFWMTAFYGLFGLFAAVTAICLQFHRLQQR